MRRIVMFNRVSADGYFAAADGKLDWVVPEAELDERAAEGLAKNDTILFGRLTYDMFESFWPRALEDPSGTTDPHHPGRRSPQMHALATWINQAEKWVFSRTRKEVTWKGSHLRHELDPREIAALREKPGKDMMIFGSGSIVSQLTEHGLIDEYQLVVTPVFLGGGRALLGGLAKRTGVKLVEAKAYPSGNVLLRYARPG